MSALITVYGIFLTCFTGARGENDFFLAVKPGSNYYYCVTNSIFALSWISKPIKEKYSQVSTIIPETQEIQFPCDITNDQNTVTYFINSYWKLEDSSQSHTNQIILDRRWEEFETIMTKPVFKKFAKLIYHPVLSALKSDFEIPLSIRASEEAHIFLCDGNRPNESNCYWFILEGFARNRTVMRKCDKSEPVPKDNKIYPQESCKVEHTKVEHPEFPNYLSASSWTHFKLSKKQNVLTLALDTHGQEKTILKYIDEKGTIDVTNMHIHSKAANALWKIHSIDYIYTRSITQHIQLGSYFYSSQTPVCLSMFLWMCDSCELKLSLADSSGKIMDEKSFNLGHSRWTEIKFVSNKLESDVQMKLLVSTLSESSDRFWALDKVRMCHPQEYRMISLTDRVICQLMYTDKNIISDDSNVRVDENRCPDNSVGDFCVPCDLMGYDICSKTKICTKNKCVCSAGFKGLDCATNCDANTFGHGCLKQCNNCLPARYGYQKCNNVNGACSSGCIDGYSGPRCDNPMLRFRKAPEIADVTITTAAITVKDFSLEEDPQFSLQSAIYTIQYKKESDSVWSSHNPSYEFNKTKTVIIQHLEADSSYHVRAIIVFGDVQNVGSDVKFARFTTHCIDISLENASVRSTNTSISLFLSKQINPCKLHRYKIFLKEANTKPYQNESHVYFDHLNPFTHYTITFQDSDGNIQTKKIQTTEGVPERIQSLLIKDKSSTTIDLSWVEPSINGHFIHYVIEYQLVSHIACKHDQTLRSNKQQLTLTANSISLHNLNPFSNYTFSIFAKNSIFEGPRYSFFENTLAEKTIGAEEQPNITVSPHIYSTQFRIVFNCEALRGPILVHLNVSCTNEWCNKKISRSFIHNTSTLEVNGLYPFSDYVVDPRFCRDEYSCDSKTEITIFKTQPTVPNHVTDLSIYSKDVNSFKMRWKPPYPPTGVLAEYKIIYYSGYWYQKEQEQIFNVTSCTIWKDFHCATVSNLQYSETYTLEKILARNAFPPEFNSQTIYPKVTTTTKKEKSEMPYNLSLTWTSLNDLQLSWNHPNVTNGDVQYFQIELEYQKSVLKKHLYVSDTNVTLHYYYIISAAEIIPATYYSIKVFVFNAYKGKTAVMSTESPPDIPELNPRTQIYSDSNDSITLDVSMKKPRGYYDYYQIFLAISEYHPLSTVGQYKSIYNCTVTNFDDVLSITIGNNLAQKKCTSIPIKLKSGTYYNVTVSLLNQFGNQSREQSYSFNQKTLGVGKLPTGNANLLGLLALLFIIPLAVVIYLKWDLLISAGNQMQRRNNSAEILNKQEEPIPLSGVVKQPQNNKPKIQEKPSAVASKICSKRIKLVDLEEYVRESIASGELQRQHSLFPRGPTKAWNYGSTKENKPKNRYNNLIAYDHSRVVLQKLAEDSHSDYINASYINDYRVPRAYIATQGPKVATLNDFWRMIWQENVRHIANVANIFEGGKKKLEKYWPDINETLRFAEISVQHESSKVYADYEYRVFTVSNGADSRKVDQLHFLSWPDHGVPLYSQSLVPFLQRMLQLPISSKSPIVVHCSAGVGRTGTILLCDICLRMAAGEGAVDVLRNLELLREQRANMVDNIEQYKLAHLVILECLVGMRTSIPCSDIEDSVERLLDGDDLPKQMHYLNESKWQDQAMKTILQVSEHVPIVHEKNRFQHILPEMSGRVFIPRFPPDDEYSSYINAVRVDGFRSPERYIVTQQPMPNTVFDFWRLVDCSNVSVIISLNAINPKDTTTCGFWPTSDQPQMNFTSVVSLQHVNTTASQYYNISTVNLYTTTRKDHLQVQIITLKKWPPRTKCPKDIKHYLAFWEQADALARRSNPTIITCHDGVTASGLYVATSFIIEKMKLEQICDVCQAVRTVRHNREQFVQDMEQFKFLYKMAMIYISGFGPYANFN